MEGVQRTNWKMETALRMKYLLAVFILSKISKYCRFL